MADSNVIIFGIAVMLATGLTLIIQPAFTLALVFSGLESNELSNLLVILFFIGFGGFIVGIVSPSQRKKT